jgi:hypothetical protein
VVVGATIFEQMVHDIRCRLDCDVVIVRPPEASPVDRILFLEIVEVESSVSLGAQST